MKTINQLVRERTEHLSTSKDGSVNPSEILRVRIETYFRFWAPWVVILYPLAKIDRPSMTVDDIFSGEGRATMDDRVAGAKLLAKDLGVHRIGFETFFELREIIADAVHMSKRHEDVDIALCALMAFVQLELGAELDPEYGCFPERASFSEARFNDADLSDDPAEAEVQLEERSSTYENCGSSPVLRARLFRSLEAVVADPQLFDERFPGMGDRRANVERALAPIFARLDPVLDGFVPDLFLRWIKRLPHRPLDESRIVGPPKPDNVVAA
ncbi:hypothetical protein ABIF07_005459 [Bradyrhizobium elkanii]|uniref:hypothetical protein n=1 Tax=Bradyrhizobium elkanii TaxID=29448 RepID=UPI002167983D|nr:hypothetical protein [Bradyrhizobium elkanii]MCS3687514.1 hypothetical protein [Bradyrhizobium elkanii]